MRMLLGTVLMLSFLILTQSSTILCAGIPCRGGRASLNECGDIVITGQPIDNGIRYVYCRFRGTGGALSGKKVIFTARSESAFRPQALYIRAYNIHSECLLSYQNWNSPLKKEPQTIELIPGFSSAGFTWERDLVVDTKDQTIAEWEFVIGVRKAEKQTVEATLSKPVLESYDVLSHPGAGFEELGIAAYSAELRSSIAYVDSTNNHKMLLSRPQDHGKTGYLLLTDITTGETRSYYNPPSVRQGDNFGSILTSKGIYMYDQHGARVVAFDVHSKKMKDLGRPGKKLGTCHYMVYAEADNGLIYMGGYPTCDLVAYNPASGKFRSYGRLDAREKYIHHLATDKLNYVYAGIGTACANIVAINPETGEKKQILPVNLRTLGTGLVESGSDGYVYASFDRFKAKLLRGKIVELAPRQVPLKSSQAAKYFDFLWSYSDGSKVTSVDLYRRVITYQESSGEIRSIPFTYKSGGLEITSLVNGPNKSIYLSTCHPFHFVRYDTVRGKMEDLGPNPYVGGGNFCNMTSDGTRLYACEYPAGRIWTYDPRRSVNVLRPSFDHWGRSPKELAQRIRAFGGTVSSVGGSNTTRFVFGKATSADNRFVLSLQAPSSGDFYFNIQFLQHDTYGSVKLTCREKSLTKNLQVLVDEPSDVIHLGPYRLSEGERVDVSLKAISNGGFSNPWFGILGASLSHSPEEHRHAYDLNLNPSISGRWKNTVTRPRAIGLHPDGQHVIMSGFANYGLNGGGFGIHNLRDHSNSEISQLLPGHSCITFDFLPDGSIVGGTSIDAPGGGHICETQAAVFRLNWKTHTLDRVTKVKNCKNFVSVVFYQDKVFAAEQNGTVYVFDTQNLNELKHYKLNYYGRIPRNGFQKSPDGRLFLLQSNGISEYQPSEQTWKNCMLSPEIITAGGGIQDGYLYFAAWTKLCRWKISLRKGSKSGIQGTVLPLPQLTEVISLRESTVLTEKGKGRVVIMHPDSRAGKQSAQQIADVLKQVTGADIPCTVGNEKHGIPGRTAILLGNYYSNPAIRVLYARMQTYVDDYFPGKSGFTVESIMEPFQTGRDVIVIGASDDEGLTLGSKFFCQKLRQVSASQGTLAFPYTFIQHLGKDLTVPKMSSDRVSNGLAEARERLSTGAHQSLGRTLADIGQRYGLYRSSEDARLYVEVARLYLRHALSAKGQFGGPWGFDSDFPSFQAIASWDLVEHDPNITSEDRLLVSNMLLHWIHEAIFAEARMGLKEVGPVHNHMTFCSLGAMMGGLYFSKYYDQVLPHAKLWLDTACRNFSRQIVSGKAYDDCDGYVWLTWEHIMRYSLAMPDKRVIRNGNAQRALRLLSTTMDNLYKQTPYGDNKYWCSNSANIPFLRLFFAATQDPLAGRLLTLKLGNRPRWQPGAFNKKRMVFHDPDDLDGVTILPLDSNYYRFMPAKHAKPNLLGCFDKFSFRESLNPDSLYVLVDGVNNGGHAHEDANSVLRFTCFKREWLAENGYFFNQQKYHNTLLMVFDGQAFPLPEYMEVIGHKVTQDIAWIGVKASAWGKSDWIRHYVWLRKENAWVALDDVTFKDSGTCRLTQRWNGVGKRRKTLDGWVLEQQGAFMALQCAQGMTITARDDAELGMEWKNYPFASSVINVMDQTMERTVKAGDNVQLIGVWHGLKNLSTGDWSIVQNSLGFDIYTGDRHYQLKMDDSHHLTIAHERSSLVLHRSQVPQHQAVPSTGKLKVLWQHPAISKTAEAVGMTTLRHGLNYLLATATEDGRIQIFNRSGAFLSSFKLDARITQIKAYDCDQDQVDELVIGSETGMLYVVDIGGRERWHRQFPFFHERPSIRQIDFTNIDADDQLDIIVGCDNWFVYALKSQGDIIWKREIHPVRAMHIVQSSSSGKSLIVVGTKYMGATVLNQQGQKCWGGKWGIGCTAAVAPEVHANVDRHIVLGMTTGALIFSDLNGNKLTDFHTGDKINALSSYSRSDGKQNVLAISENGYAYRFDVSGKKLWHVSLPESGRQLLALTGLGCVVGTPKGKVILISEQGNIVGSHKCQGEIKAFGVMDSQLIALASTGELVALELSESYQKEK